MEIFLKIRKSDKNYLQEHWVTINEQTSEKLAKKRSETERFIIDKLRRAMKNKQKKKKNFMFKFMKEENIKKTFKEMHKIKFSFRETEDLWVDLTISQIWRIWQFLWVQFFDKFANLDCVHVLIFLSLSQDHNWILDCSEVWVGRQNLQ